MEKFNKIDFINIIDDGKKNTNMLLELIKTNVRKERRIYELLNSNTSFNKYIDISKENVYYLTQYNYSVQGVKNLDKGAVDYTFEKDDYDNKFTLISLDLIIVTLMKLLSVRKFNKIFFLPTRKKVLDNDNYLNKIKNINRFDEIKRRVCLLINYDDLDNEIERKLKKNEINYYVYASKNTIVDSNILDEKSNYLVSKDFYLEHKELIDEKIKNKQQIIIESFEKVLTDRMLVEEEEN